MKIEGSKINPMINQYKEISNRAPKKKPKNFGKEKAEFSSKSKEVEKLAKKVQIMPEVRAKVVEKIKREIENGHYPIDVNKIAQSIVDTLVI